jgi:predicted NUDIX family NTP pyrophosphohydrolase
LARGRYLLLKLFRGIVDRGSQCRNSALPVIAWEAEVFLVHPGGPYWANKDEYAWSVPKGIANPEEDYLFAARREFREETGFAPDGDFLPLGSFRQPSGK